MSDNEGIRLQKVLAQAGLVRAREQRPDAAHLHRRLGQLRPIARVDAGRAHHHALGHDPPFPRLPSIPWRGYSAGPHGRCRGPARSRWQPVPTV